VEDLALAHSSESRVETAAIDISLTGRNASFVMTDCPEIFAPVLISIYS
jgi:hypothetical protein